MRIRQDVKNFWKDVLVLVAMVGFAIMIVQCTGCTSIRTEYEHVSHPLAGWPFGPANEEDTLDVINACLVRSVQVSERVRSFGESCLGYRLTDGGFYGPELTGGFRAGFEFSLSRGPSRESTHNALGGYRDACGELPGMVGDDC